jgi:hypothetical protein
MIMSSGEGAGRQKPEAATASVDRDQDSPTFRIVSWLVLALGLAVLLFGPHDLTGDARDRFVALDALLSRGEVSATHFSLVGPLFSTPLWLLGRLGPSPETWCAGYNYVLFVLAILLMDRLLRGAVSGPVRRRFLLLLVYGSMFPHHVQDYYGEVFTAVLVAVGLLAVAVHGSPWGWPSVVLGAINAPATTVGVFLAAGAWCLWTRRLRFILAVAACAFLILLEWQIRRGSPLATGYAGDHGFSTVMPFSGLPGFSYPVFFGLLSILFSFGKGLLFFAPGLLLPIRADAPVGPGARAAYRLWLLFLGGLVLIYAPWWAWYGGWFWGPRFFLFASIPAAFALAVSLAEARRQSLARNLVTLLLLALSCWVALDGAVFGMANLQIGQANDYALESLTWYAPEFSVLWRPFVTTEGTQWWEWLRAAAFGVGFCWLAAPLFVVVLRQAAGALRDAWRVHAGRGPWRL